MKLNIKIKSILKKILLMLSFVIICQMVIVHNTVLKKTTYSIENPLSIIVAWPGGMYCDPVKEKHIQNIRKLLTIQKSLIIHFITETKQIQKSEKILKLLKKDFRDRVIIYDLDLNNTKLLNGITIEPFKLKDKNLLTLNKFAQKLYKDLKNKNSTLRAINPASLSDIIRLFSIFGLDTKNDDNEVFIYMDIGDTIKQNLSAHSIENLKNVYRQIKQKEYQTFFPGEYNLTEGFIEIDLIISAQSSNIILNVLNQISKEMYLKSELLFQEDILKSTKDFGFFYKTPLNPGINIEAKNNLEYITFAHSSIFSKKHTEQIFNFLNNLNHVNNYEKINYLFEKFYSLKNFVIKSTGPLMLKKSISQIPEEEKKEYKRAQLTYHGRLNNEAGWLQIYKYKIKEDTNPYLQFLVLFFHNYFGQNIDPKIEINGTLQKLNQEIYIEEISEVKETLKILFNALDNVKEDDLKSETQLIHSLKEFKNKIQEKNWKLNYKETQILYYKTVQNVNRKMSL